MTSSTQNRIAVAAAVGVPCAVALWLLTAASGAVPSTYVLAGLLLISIALIVLNTWNNAQPTGSMAQVIHEAEMSPGTRDSVRLAAEAHAARRDAWQSRAGALSDTNRIRVLVAVSAAVTSALLFYAWRA